MPFHQYQPAPHFTDEVVDNETLTAEIETARKHLAAAIEAKGEDYVYRSVPEDAGECLYLEYEAIEEDEEHGYVFVGPKGPSCIVGHVLVGLEIPFEKITPNEGENAEAAIKGLDAFKSVIVTEALFQAQTKQDHANGHTWGEAVEEFEAHIERHTWRVDA
jgi:hypothetical protein